MSKTVVGLFVSIVFVFFSIFTTVSAQNPTASSGPNPFSHFDPLPILQVGLAGLIFLLALLSWYLINQNRNPRLVMVFMAVCFAFSVIAYLHLHQSNRDTIDPGKKYPEVVTAVNELLKREPCVYRDRCVFLDFSESQDSTDLTVDMTLRTEVFNPRSSIVEEPHVISTTREEFQSIRVYQVDQAQADRKGELAWKLDQIDYLRLPGTMHGRAKVVEVGKLIIGPQKAIIIETKYRARMPRQSEIPIMTGRVMTGELQAVLNFAGLDPSRFSSGVQMAALPSTKFVPAGRGETSKAVYKMAGLQLPGHGMILDWDYTSGKTESKPSSVEQIKSQPEAKYRISPKPFVGLYTASVDKAIIE
jgi:hypothetical protein